MISGLPLQLGLTIDRPNVYCLWKIDIGLVADADVG